MDILQVKLMLKYAGMTLLLLTIRSTKSVILMLVIRVQQPVTQEKNSLLTHLNSMQKNEL